MARIVEITDLRKVNNHGKGIIYKQDSWTIEFADGGQTAIVKDYNDMVGTVITFTNAFFFKRFVELKEIDHIVDLELRAYECGIPTTEYSMRA